MDEKKDCGNENKKCEGKVEIYARVCGFYTNTRQWNIGKVAEFKDRTNYDLKI